MMTPSEWVSQQYRPEALEGHVYYEPSSAWRRRQGRPVREEGDTCGTALVAATLTMAPLVAGGGWREGGVGGSSPAGAATASSKVTRCTARCRTNPFHRDPPRLWCPVGAECPISTCRTGRAGPGRPGQRSGRGVDPGVAGLPALPDGGPDTPPPTAPVPRSGAGGGRLLGPAQRGSHRRHPLVGQFAVAGERAEPSSVITSALGTPLGSRSGYPATP